MPLLPLRTACHWKMQHVDQPKNETIGTYLSSNGKEFDEPPTEEETLSFISELGHSRKIKYNTDVIVDHLHQPWRTFASIINKYLCGKVSGFDKIRLSRVQILYGMYYKKNLDYVALIWEDMAYHIDNIDSKKQDKMDDNVLGTMRFIFRHADTQKKYIKAKKVAATKPRPTKKKAPVKADRGKGLNVLSDVALSEAAQLKEATK
ncbi:hypothetical protein Tco_0562666 [Tanacetum coccineum]